MIRLRALATLGLAIAAAPAMADPIADFYAGKSVNLIVSTGVGGGVDANARILARHLSDHIPGNPSIVVRNMTGAGHLQATNFMFNGATKDGTYVAAILPTFVGYQALDGRGAQYDARKFPFLGSSDVENANLYVWHDLGVTKIEQVKTKEVLMGATGAGSYTMLYPTLLNNTIGTKFKIVSGYKSTNEIHLAMERGEVSGRAGNFFTSLKSQNPDWLRDGKIAMLLQFGAVRDPQWQDTPLLTDLAENDEQRSIFKAFSAEVALGKVFVTTPGVPQERLEALRRAFADTLADPAYVDDCKRAEMLVRPATWQADQALAADIVGMSPEVVAKAKAAMELKPADERKAAGAN